MKKIIIGLAVVFSAVVANAEYLYWSVSSSEAAAAHANGAILWWNANKSTSNSTSLDNLTVANSTSSKADLSGISNYQDGYYYIELVNYNGAIATSLEPSKTSNYYTYADLSGAFISSLSDLNAATMVMTMTGPKATPEPTSGLLLLMGFAMLGLKRKKEV